MASELNVGSLVTDALTTASDGVITATTGTSGDTAGIAALAAGSIRLSNFSGGSAIPALIGKSNDSIGLEIVGATNNSNTSGDLVFNVRENDNSDFATTTTAAFKFTRWNVDLVTILRNGLATFSNGIAFSSQTDATGTGITSGATTLNHYEVGTWTPVLSDGTNNATSTIADGSYTRIGDLVTAKCYLLTSSLGSVSGDVRVTGLPFASESSGNYWTPVAIPHAYGLNITAGQNLGGFLRHNVSYFELRLWDSAVGTTTLQASEWSANGECVLTVTYKV